MKYLLDSNILLYAKMDAMPEHAVISKWLVETLRDKNTSVTVCETLILSFLRISTNIKIFDPPLSFSESKKFVRSLLVHPQVNVSATSSSHYIALIDFMEKHDFIGNLVMDAHLAVLASSIGAVLVTRDKDFKKIPRLKTLNPLSK